MDVLIIEEKQNDFFKRKEIVTKFVDVKKPLTRDEIRQEVAKKLMYQLDSLVLVKAIWKYDEKSIVAEFRYYPDRESLMSFEKRYILKRNKLIEEAGKDGDKK